MACDWRVWRVACLLASLLTVQLRARRLAQWPLCTYGQAIVHTREASGLYAFATVRSFGGCHATPGCKLKLYQLRCKLNPVCLEALARLHTQASASKRFGTAGTAAAAAELGRTARCPPSQDHEQSVGRANGLRGQLRGPTCAVAAVLEPSLPTSVARAPAAAAP